MRTTDLRDFGPFIPECSKKGLGKTKAYELANAGLLETFLIGSKRYIYLDSLLTLPQRLLVDLVAKGGAATACCPMNPDGKRSLSVDLASHHGKWNCPICGAGDMIDFDMRLHDVTFVDAVPTLVQGVR